MSIQESKMEKKQLNIILLIVFISFIGASIAYPLFPPLFMHPQPGSDFLIHLSARQRNIFLGIALAVYPFGQFIGSPILGGCSDRYGRKKVLILSLFGSTLGYLFSAIALFWDSLSLLLLSRFVTGLLEGNLAIVRAMAADLRSLSKYKSLGRINGVAAIGYVMGPLLSGFFSNSQIVSWFSYAFPFLVATLFSFAATLMAYLILSDNMKIMSSEILTIWQQFHLYARFKKILTSSETLKYLLIISTVFTFSVDIFYEFGPVYLTGLWFMSASDIAIYNAILCLGLSVGSSWLPGFLSKYIPVNKSILFAILVTAFIFACLVIFPNKILAWILFGLAGFSIACVNTNITVKVTDVAHNQALGETIGAQYSLRMLGDTLICIAGGFLIISSVILPICICSLIAFISAALFLKKML